MDHSCLQAGQRHRQVASKDVGGGKYKGQVGTVHSGSAY